MLRQHFRRRRERGVRIGRHLGWLALLAVLLLAASSGWIAAAAQEKSASAYPIFTAEHFVSVMKSVGLGFDAASRLVNAGDYEAAKVRFIRTREQLAPTVTFWRDRDTREAIEMFREALARLDSIDDALSMESIDPAEVGTRVEKARTACQGCHVVFRDQDPATKEYRFKGVP